jgi:hypothetical protein
MKDVEAFAAEHDLHDIIPDLKKGAIVAQNPGGFDEMEELSAEEKDALRFEVTHKWRHPSKLYITIIVCSIGAAVQYVLSELFRIFRAPLTSFQRLGSDWFERCQFVLSHRVRHPDQLGRSGS